MPASSTSTQNVAGIDVSVNGAQLDPSFRNLLTEVKVVDSLTLPDMAMVRINDPKGENVDSQPFQIGAELEIKAAATGSRSFTRIFKGQVAAIEPEFNPHGVTISIRAYDKAHKLNRERKTRTFQQMSASDMVNKIAGESGLQADVTSTSVVHEFFQQSNETDWAFVWKLALMHDYEVVVSDTTLAFRPANEAEGSPVSLKWQDNMISFRPRMSGVQQPTTVNVRGWDPKAKQTVTGSAGSAQTSSKPGVTRAKVASGLGGGTTAVTDRVVDNTGEANALATSTLNRVADAFYEADGVAFGDPAIKAGCGVKVEGVGSQFSGEFTVTSATHSYRGAVGYRTSFQIAGRSSRTLLELIRPPQDRDWSRDLVVGVVTNIKDPEKMARVRVKYPSLSDNEESAWARVATPSSGNARGVLMLPTVNEEVIVGFEHGDTRRPIVLGSVFNGKDKPGDEMYQEKFEGSFVVLSDEKIHQHSKKDFEITSDKDMIVQVTGDEKHTVDGSDSHTIKGNEERKVTGSYKHEAQSGSVKVKQSYALEAGTTMSIKGSGSVTVETSGSLTLKGATVDIQGSGPVNIRGAIINLG